MNNPAIDIPITSSSTTRRWNLPVWLVIICFVTFSVLLGAGVAIWKNAPPIPAIARSPSHEIVLTQADIKNGQETYLARGGQHIGSVWGHGSYLAPDWTADFLHRWGLATAGVLYDGNSDFGQADLEAIAAPERASLEARVKQNFKTNRYNSETQELLLTDVTQKLSY